MWLLLLVSCKLKGYFTLGAAQVSNGVACRILKFLTNSCKLLIFDSTKDVPVLLIHHFFRSALVKLKYSVNAI